MPFLAGVHIHRHPHVSGVRAHYGSLLTDRDAFDSVRGHLEALALAQWDGLRRDPLPALLAECTNYLPGWSGLAPEEAIGRWPGAGPGSCRTCWARQTGFPDWAAVQALGDRPYDEAFECAVDAMLEGRLGELEGLLRERPDLVATRSVYGHRATLLHYAVANGTELWRQQVPANLAESVALLLRQGADPSATAPVYGCPQTPRALLRDSAHPRNAGLAEALDALLAGRGA